MALLGKPGTFYTIVKDPINHILVILFFFSHKMKKCGKRKIQSTGSCDSSIEEGQKKAKKQCVSPVANSSAIQQRNNSIECMHSINQNGITIDLISMLEGRSETN